MLQFRIGRGGSCAVSLLTVGLAVAGCSGAIADRDAPAATAGTGGGGRNAPRGGATASGGAGGTPASCGPTLALAPSLMRRMTNDEYAATVRDLFQLPVGATFEPDLPRETRVGSFENDPRVQTLSSQHMAAYLRSAEGLTADLLKDASRRDAVIGCSPSGTARTTCVRTFVERFGRLAFRRPLAAEDTDRYVQLGTGAVDGYAAIERVMHAMLVSPRFLFLAEIGRPMPDRPEYVTLDGYERATRLAFFLWGRSPDDALLTRAAAGELDAPVGLRTTVARMLADDRSSAGVASFYRRWLGIDQLRELEIDKAAQPKFDEPLRASMQQETSRFVADLFASADSKLDTLVTAEHSFVDAALAKLYGATGGAGATFARTTLGRAERGAGVLTHASFLALTGQSEGAAPIRRGAYVRSVLLCDQLPPPPADIPALEQAPVPATATIRERLAAHEQNPTCAGCHSRLDPVGFALSRYDGVGAYRTTDSAGRPIDAKGRLSQDGSDVAVEGAAALGTAIAATPAFRACVATQLFRYAMARSETPEDACAIGDVVDRGGAGLRTLVEAVAGSEAFGMRRPATTNLGGMQ